LASSDREHWPALDGLRGLAALSVAAVHVLVLTVGGLPFLAETYRGPVGWLLNAKLAVETFFVLSGFVLAGSLLRHRSLAELPQYYVRRFFRIHPPYVIAVLFAWCASFLYRPPHEGARGFGSLANVHLTPPELLRSLLFPGGAGLQLPVGWTLEVEAIFSLLLPAMLLVARRTHGLVLVSLCTLPLLLHPHGLRDLNLGVDFAAGIALHLERERLARWLSRIGPLGGAVLAVSALAVGNVPRILGWYQPFHGGEDPRGIVFQCLGATGLTLGAAFVPSLRRLLSRRPCVLLGRVSYSLYLLHLPVALLLASLPFEATARLLPLPVFAVVLPLSALGWRFVERPSIAAGNLLCAALARRTGARDLGSRLGEMRDGVEPH
jgi:peptidoglycan/LPS O-acetylase OafA/YrhL